MFSDHPASQKRCPQCRGELVLVWKAQHAGRPQYVIQTLACEGCEYTMAEPARLVHRYNAEGLQGPHNRAAPGAKPRLSAEQEREVAELCGRYRIWPSMAGCAGDGST